MSGCGFDDAGSGDGPVSPPRGPDAPQPDGRNPRRHPSLGSRSSGIALIRTTGAVFARTWSRSAQGLTRSGTEPVAERRTQDTATGSASGPPTVRMIVVLPKPGRRAVSVNPSRRRTTSGFRRRVAATGADVADPGIAGVMLTAESMPERIMAPAACLPGAGRTLGYVPDRRETFRAPVLPDSFHAAKQIVTLVRSPRLQAGCCPAWQTFAIFKLRQISFSPANLANPSPPGGGFASCRRKRGVTS